MDEIRLSNSLPATLHDLTKMTLELEGVSGTPESTWDSQVRVQIKAEKLLHRGDPGPNISYIPCLRMALAEVAFDCFCAPPPAVPTSNEGCDDFIINLWLITGRHRILCQPLACYRETLRWAMHVRTIEIKVQASAQGDKKLCSFQVYWQRSSVLIYSFPDPEEYLLHLFQKIDLQMPWHHSKESHFGKLQNNFCWRQSRSINVLNGNPSCWPSIHSPEEVASGPRILCFFII